MKISSLNIKDVQLIEPDIFCDERGQFIESYNKNLFAKLFDKKFEFVQDNYSISKFGTLRGLHYQVTPNEQGKLIYLTQGEVFFVALDIRKQSSTYGLYVNSVLSFKKKNQLWIPPGFATGFLALTRNVGLIYKVTNFYSKKDERIIRYDDPMFKIEWPRLSTSYILSEKDKNALYV